MLFEIESTITKVHEKENELYDLEDGFIRGNMFKKLYEGYKNYCPSRIETKDEKTHDLLIIMMLDFALNDLNLYLDLNPNDHETYEVFKEYSLYYKKMLLDYEKKYQVLCLTDDTFGKYTWISNPWPWEVKNV